MLRAIVAICVGSSFGAVLRWVLGMRLNALYPAIPPGTLAANAIGGFVIGFAIAYFADARDIAPEWRLFIITGFCGGLTTFSTFSAEVVSLLQEGDVVRAAAAIGLHLAASFAATILGIALWQWIAAH
ncbi:MAG TPA: fluoride efflux transporter CrcB [Usitatibacter sp.]|nr:fluoride efflux transporter CrcB [Usitatibacter sp.]